MAVPIAGAKKPLLPSQPSASSPWLFKRTLNSVGSPENLIIRDHLQPSEIVGLAELSIAAVLAGQHDRLLHSLYTDKKGTQSLLDLAVRFGHAEFAAVLAECGVKFHGHLSIVDEKCIFKEHAGRSLRAVVRVAEKNQWLIQDVTVTIVCQWAGIEDHDKHSHEYTYLDIALKLGMFEAAAMLARCGVPLRSYSAIDLASWANRRYVQPELPQSVQKNVGTSSGTWPWPPAEMPQRCTHTTLQLPLPNAQRPRYVITEQNSVERAPCTHGFKECRFCCHYFPLDPRAALNPKYDQECNSSAARPWSVFMDMLRRHIFVASFSKDVAKFLRLCRFESEGLLLGSLLDIGIRFGALEATKELLCLQVPLTTDILFYGHHCRNTCRVGHTLLYQILLAAELAGFSIDNLLEFAICHGHVDAVSYFIARGATTSMTSSSTLLQFSGELKESVIEAVVATGTDLRELVVPKPKLIPHKAPPQIPPHVKAPPPKPVSGTHAASSQSVSCDAIDEENQCKKEPLLATAIRYGQKKLAKDLIYKGCDSNLTVESLLATIVLGEFADACKYEVLSTALVAYELCRHRHQLAIVQLSCWWIRSSCGQISVLHAPLVENIASWAFAVPPIPQTLLLPLKSLCNCLPFNSLVQSAALSRAGLASVVKAYINFPNLTLKSSTLSAGKHHLKDATLHGHGTTQFNSVPSTKAMAHSAEKLPMPIVDTAEQPSKDLVASQDDEQLSEAIRASEAEAVTVYNADLAKAVSLSKIDRGRLNDDRIVVLRLSCRTAEVQDKLFQSEDLVNLRERVVQAGCELVPEWACGAILLVPLTQDMVVEADIGELRAHHVLVLEEDVKSIERALADIPKRRRPKVKGIVPKGPTDEMAATRQGQSDFSTDPDDTCTESHLLASQEITLKIEKTFWMHPEPKVVSECSDVTQSAPSCVPKGVDPKNPRRWGKLV